MRIFLFFIFLLAPYTSHAQKEINLDGTNIKIVAPEGYTDVLSLSEEFKSLSERFVPETNQLIAYYLPHEEARKFLLPDFDPYVAMQYDRKFMLQANKATITQKLSKNDFSYIKNLIKKEQLAIFEKIRPKIEGDANTAIKNIINEEGIEDIETNLQLSNVIPLNDFDETEKSLQFGTIMKVQLDFPSHPEEELESYVLVNQAAFTAINGIMFYLYGYSAYTSEDDIAWTQGSTKKWTESFILTNSNLPNFADRKNDATGIDLGKATEKAIVGGLSGGLMALVLGLITGVIAWLSNLIRKDKKDK